MGDATTEMMMMGLDSTQNVSNEGKPKQEDQYRGMFAEMLSEGNQSPNEDDQEE
jgi:hypothetical protein